jgi:hypothetical protein
MELDQLHEHSEVYIEKSDNSWGEMIERKLLTVFKSKIAGINCSRIRATAAPSDYPHQMPIERLTFLPWIEEPVQREDTSGPASGDLVRRIAIEAYISAVRGDRARVRRAYSDSD